MRMAQETGAPLTDVAKQRVDRCVVGCCRDACLASPCLSWGQNPAVLSLNGSLLVHAYVASLAAQVSSGDTFARAHVHTSCSHTAHLDAGLQHAWPPLQALGVAPDNHIRVSVGGDKPPRAQLEVALGQCTLTAHGDVRTEADAKRTNWTLSLENRCPPLEATGVPRALRSEGHLSWGRCEFDLAAGLHSDSGDAHLQLVRACGPQTSVLGHLTHSLPLLGRLGLPPSSTINLTAGAGPTARSSLALRGGPCQLQGTLEQHAGNRSAWTLAAEPGCPLLEALGVPGRVHGSGYIVVNSMALDTQVLVTVDASTLRGLLILKTTEVSEELTFTRRPEHVSLDYTLQHNIPALRTLRVEDRMGLQVSPGARR
ncbi:uncharacterized protein LOC131422651 isoform X2 [Diceros bicornis minor]|uniref:uncharacterized protein LOC131422651 isoform X2 n=1 Tax=Diceros bicornis minor TaxID=77932 RepID=UPI0026EDBB42|nr:uncharacterized protein LOC131422651 isoform X2 [Diceros bicornis minor]